MSLKRFSDFTENKTKIEQSINEDDKIKESKDIKSKDIKSKDIKSKDIKSKDIKSKDIKSKGDICSSNKSKIENISENFKLKNKVAEFLNKDKPSDTYKYLVKKKISPDDVKFVISEQDNSLSLFKYDFQNETNLSEFGEALIIYYKKNPKLSKILEQVKINGNDKFVIIQNLPDEKFIKVIKNNLIDLIK